MQGTNKETAPSNPPSGGSSGKRLASIDAHRTKLLLSNQLAIMQALMQVPGVSSLTSGLSEMKIRTVTELHHMDEEEHRS